MVSRLIHKNPLGRISSLIYSQKNARVVGYGSVVKLNASSLRGQRSPMSFPLWRRLFYDTLGRPRVVGSVPIGSMYGIFTYIWPKFMVNVGEYTIHGSYGVGGS